MKNATSDSDSGERPQTKKVKLESSISQMNQENNCPSMLTSPVNGSASNSPSPPIINSPTRVVHIRNVPLDANENDVISIGLPFGRITNALLLKGKNQAFLEFVDIFSAQSMVNYWHDSNNSALQPTIKGRHVFVQFSNHKELKKTSILSASNEGHNNFSSSPSNNHQTTANGSSGIGDQNNMTSVNSNNSNAHTVLRVVVENIVFPVSLDTFYQIFSRFGKVTKIVTFTKNVSFQALIQFENSFNATSAKNSLDGQQMFSSGNIFRIDFSKLSNLNVKYNNEKSRDFTNPLLPPVGLPTASSSSSASSLAAISSALHHHTHPHHHPSSIDPLAIDPLTLATFGLSGNGAGSGTASAQGGSLSFTSGSSHHGSLGIHPSHAFPTLSSSGIHCVGTVLLVSNLNEEMATPDALFTLFGVYGDVTRVKILFNKKDNALVQMAEPQQAQLAMNYLDKVKVFGKPLKILASRHASVQMPKEGQPDSGLTKDFSSSLLHRFKKPGSKNYQNIYPPSSTLHLSNIPASSTEEDIREAFEQTGGVHVVNFKFFPRDRKMALIQLSSVDDAIHGLIKMHNYQLSESNHLRVSFSKSSI